MQVCLSVDKGRNRSTPKNMSQQNTELKIFAGNSNPPLGRGDQPIFEGAAGQGDGGHLQRWREQSRDQGKRSGADVFVFNRLLLRATTI